MKQRPRIILAIVLTSLILGAVVYFAQQSIIARNTPQPEPIVLQPKVVNHLLTQEDIDRTIGEVATIHGRAFKKEVEVTHIDTTQLREYIETVAPIEFPSEEVIATQDMWELWGIIDPAFNLEETLRTLYSQGTAGLYDDRSERLYLIDGYFSTFTQQTTLAHELTHALEDQWFDFSNTTDPLEIDEADDALLAFTALAEGSAMRTMEQYGRDYPVSSLLAIGDAFSETSITATEILNTLPPVLREQILFPYEEGYAFLKYYFEQHPDGDISDVYKNPPRSTAEILHPESYPRLIPASILFPTFASEMLLDEGVFGEWQLREILKQSLGEEQASLASDGWINDRYLLLERNDHRTLLATIEWASEQDAEQFETALSAYLNQRFGEGKSSTNTSVLTYGDLRSFSLHRVGTRTLFLLGDDRAMVLTLTPAINQ